MALDNILEEVQLQTRRIKNPDSILGKGLMMPYNYTNSGPRKLMQTIQVEQKIDLMNGEVAFLSTGAERRYGENSSSLIIAQSDYKVINKITNKFNANYILIVEDLATGQSEIFYRKEYIHITEGFGYRMNTSYIDSLQIGDTIRKGTMLMKASAFDEELNRKDGVNLKVIYNSNEFTKEDSYEISESASAKLASPMVKVVEIIANDNDILLNLYDNEGEYKSFPGINEETIDDILCVLRREKKEEALFTQSKQRLKQIQMPDTVYSVAGKVVDVQVYCNNPEMLQKATFKQVREIYEETVKTNIALDATLRPYVDQKRASYESQKAFYNASKSLEGVTYIKDKEFSGVLISFTIVEVKKAEKGDKISNRYGGKGVISRVVPDDEMPRDKYGQPVDVVFNSSTCVNRENPGQLFEHSLTFVGEQVIKYIQSGVLTNEQIIDEYLGFLDIVVPDEGMYIRAILSEISDEELETFVDNLKYDRNIYICSRPIYDQISIDVIEQLYDRFPYAKPYKMEVPMRDSRNNIRFVKARRPVISGYQYMYRLKQHAEEKFSVVSLSSTNLRNQNSRSSAKKNYKSFTSSTPIRLGDMEMGDLLHMGAEVLVEILLMYSASPHARRGLAKQVLTGDPFDSEINIDLDASNRAVEITKAYLLAMGLEIEIIKIPKRIIEPIVIYSKDALVSPLKIYDDKGKKVLQEAIEIYKELECPIQIIEED